jgi:ferritin-like metal-binding protein YciE
MKLETLNELFLEQIVDLHSAETQLVKALPKMAKAASHPELKNAFETHLVETERHVQRLDAILKRMGQKASSKTCKAMKGLIEEGQEMVSSKGDPAVVDAGLIAAAQRVEHYEIAGYGCAKTYADLIGDHEAASALTSSLDEEKAANEKLNDLAIQVINPMAAASR